MGVVRGVGGLAEGLVLRGELLPELHGGTLAVLDADHRGVGLVAVGGAVALAAVGADDKIILIDMDAGVSGMERIDERDGMRQLFDLITERKVRAVAGRAHLFDQHAKTVTSDAG